MHLSDVIMNLSAMLRLPELRPGRDGSAAFRTGGILVGLLPRPLNEAAFVARTLIGPVQPDDFAPMLQRLLEHNYYADGIGGPALSLDGRGDVYLTQHFREGALGFEAIYAALGRFVTHARAVKAWLDGAAPAAPANTSFDVPQPLAVYA